MEEHKEMAVKAEIKGRTGEQAGEGEGKPGIQRERDSGQGCGGCSFPLDQHYTCELYFFHFLIFARKDVNGAAELM